MAKKAGSKSGKSNTKGARKSGSTKSKSPSGETGEDVPHVVSVPGGWAVRSSLTGRFVTDSYSEKSDAIDAGQRIARESGSKVLVHGRDGQIFHHSPVASTISESAIRDAVRSGGNLQTKAARETSETDESSRESGSKKK